MSWIRNTDQCTTNSQPTVLYRSCGKRKEPEKTTITTDRQMKPKRAIYVMCFSNSEITANVQAFSENENETKPKC
jgi:hypothetical protein